MINLSRRDGVRAVLLASSILGGLAGLSAFPASAAPVLPTGGKVAAGSAAIATSGGKLTVSQSTRDAIINWSSFSIGKGASVQIDNGSGATLNRVTGLSPTQINGLLGSTGTVYILNANGVIIGKTGVVKTGGSFVASTLNVTDANFLAGGSLTFTGPSTASIVNLGKVGSLGGNVSMIAATVQNAGTITAANGTIGLAAGSEVILTDDTQDDGGLIEVELGEAGDSLTNQGALAAAAIELRAQQGNIFALAGNDSGTISATGVANQGGGIYLVNEGGSTTVQGSLDAQGAGGTPGHIETSGQTLNLGAAMVNTHGGLWLLDPSDITIDSTAAATIETALTTGNVDEDTTAGTGGSGNIDVDAPITWSSGYGLTLNAVGAIAVNSSITVAGGGQLTLNFDTTANTSGGLNFAPGASVTFATGQTGQALTINSQAYTLEYSPADLITAMNDQHGGAFALAQSGAGGTFGYVPVPAFGGALEGLGNTITGLTITASNNDDVGLIGILESGVVRDINLSGGSVSGGKYVGALVGLTFQNTEIQNSTASATVSGTGNGVGGLVGFGQGAIAASSAAGQVSGTGLYVGGLVGYNLGTVEASHATGAVSGTNDVGGLAGYGGAGVIETSYATGAVSGGQYVGGLVGNNTATVETSYATGAVSGSSGYAGGLVGYNHDTVETSYATGRVSGSDRLGGLVGQNSGTVSESHATGAVTGSGLYIGGLIGFSAGPLVETSYATGAVSGNSFVGGLIGATNGTTVSTSYATGAVTGGDYVGGLIGNASGTVETSYATGAVSGNTYVGGLAGSFSGNSLETSYATGSVSGSKNVGGLVGINYGTVDNSYATGAVSGNTDVGGLVGENRNTVETSYATGAVSGTTNFGGLVGYGYAGSMVTNSYWDASTTGQANSAGSSSSYGLTTAQLQSNYGSFMTSLGAAFGGGSGGLYPYLTAFYPNGVQALIGTATPGTQVGIYAGGGLVGNGTVSPGANGYVYAVVPAGTLGASGAEIGETVALSSGAAVSGLVYTDQGTVSANILTLPSVTSGAALETTGEATYSAFQTDLGATFGAATLSSLRTTLAADPITISALAAGGFTVDQALTVASDLTLNATGALTIAAPISVTGGDAVSLSYGAGGLSFDLTSQGFGGSLSFAAGMGEGIAGQALTINGTNYTLLYSMADLVGINGGSGDYALAQSLDASATPYTAAVVGTLSGTLEGLGNTISGLTINDTSGNGNDGLIGMSYGVVRDIGLVGGSVYGEYYAGGLVGYNQGGTVENSYATGAVSGYGNVGGLVGAENSGTIETSYATGAVSGYLSVGGLVGSGNSGTVKQSYATGAVSAGYGNVGGLVGASDAVTIETSYATGAVSGYGSVGGLVGSGNSGTIKQSYATGAVSGSIEVGGLAGSSYNTVVEASHATGAVSGNMNVGGLVGYNQGTVETSYATGAVSGSSYVGGLVGNNQGAVTAGYWDTQTTGQSASSGSSASYGLTTAQLQGSATVLTALNSGGTAFATGTGLFPYLVAFYPNSVQALTGTAPVGSQVGIYTAGGLVGGGTVSTGADGSVYAIVPAGTLGASGDKVGVTLATSSGAAVSGLTYTDQGTVSGGSLSLPTVTSGAVRETTGETTYSAFQTDLGVTFGAATLASLQTTLAADPIVLTATGAGGFTLDAAVNTGGAFSLIAPEGGVTLGQSITAAGTILVAANGAFVNEAGASALTPGSGLIFTVYSQDGSNVTGSLPANTLDGLVGTNWYNDAYSFMGGTFATTVPTENTFVYGYAATLTPSLGGSTSKVYDGLTTATSGSLSVSLAGPLTNAGGLTDSATLAFTGQVYSDADAGMGKTVTVNGVSLTGNPNNYVLSATTASAAVGEITPAPLTITADNQTKVYGAALPTLTASYSGFVNGETSTNLSTAPTLTTTATSASHVAGNPYSITASGAVDADYTISYVAGALTVTPAPLTITADNQTNVYGAALPTLTASYSGFVNGDSPTSLSTGPTLSTTATSASHVAGSPYAITASGAADSDYTISYVGGSLTVTPAPLTITADNQTNVYGNALPTLTASYTGLVNGDSPTSLATGPTLATTATSASHVSGSPYSITASSAADSDYTISYVAGALNVTPAPLTITYTAAGADSIYGTTPSGLTGSYTETGLVNGDALTGTAGWTTTATARTVVGSNLVTGAGLGADSDYTVTAIQAVGNATALTIDPAALTITYTADSEDSIYGSTPSGLTGSFTETGLVNGGALVGTARWVTPATARTNVGTYLVTGAGLRAGRDYTVTVVQAADNATALTIDPAALTITYTADSEDSIYGSTPSGLTGSYTETGLVNGGTLTGTASWSTKATARTSVGNDLVTGAGLGAGRDYTVTSVQAVGNATALTIDPAALTITYTADSADSIYGSTPSGLTGSYTETGLVNGGSLTGTARWVTPATARTNVGNYSITGTGLGAGKDYTVTVVQAVGNATALTIDPAALTITYTADSADSIYGTTPSGLTGAYTETGLVNGGALTGTARWVTPATARTKVGNYRITGLGLGAGKDYTVTAVQAAGNATALTINPAS